jgi:hypothetical protein
MDFLIGLAVLAGVCFVLFCMYSLAVDIFCESEDEQRTRREQEYILWHEEARQENQEWMLDRLYRKTDREIDRII